MGRLLELTGQKFGRLLVQDFVGINKYKQSVWNCLCDCGLHAKIAGTDLKRGNNRSCGCLRYGDRSLITKRDNGNFRCWHAMKQRCYNPNHKRYRDYGGRGIRVCERWLGKEGFANFCEDMEECPEGRSLDRKNNDGDYTPENCRWATRREQCNNRKTNKRLSFKGETKTIGQWALSWDLSKQTLWHRLNTLNWSIERALTTPVGKYKRS